jgi:hypothetical protein
MQKYGDDLLARQKEEHLNETNNTTPLKDTQRPVEGGEEQILKERNEFALGGGSVMTRRPLYKIK